MKIPHSTYRIQFQKDFRFLDCKELVPYLHDLGIGALYSSPRYRARRGSTHGYDVASPLRVNSELGTDEEFDELCEKLQHYAMGLVLDIVPNHMVASHENPWWMDVLENGPSSRYAGFFDIDWHPPISKAAFLQENKVLLPVLGDLYGSVLERQELTLRMDDEGFHLRYYERRLPLDPKSYPAILDDVLARLEQTLRRNHALVTELREIRDAANGIPDYTTRVAAEIVRRMDEGRNIKHRLFSLYRDQTEVRSAIDDALIRLNGLKGEPATFAALHELLERQPYRLAYWKIAFEEINYRRFFDINDLICLRADQDEVFHARHLAIMQLVSEGKVTGLRVDHIDGIRDPYAYLELVHQAARSASSDSSIYVIVEKILGRGEVFPADWKSQGTTGYDFLNAVGDLFTHPEGYRDIVEAYVKLTGENQSFQALSYGRNKLVMARLFAGEVNSLGRHLGYLAARDKQARDIPLSELMEALVEVTAHLPVYRTYIRGYEISEQDREYLERTIAIARGRSDDKSFDFLRSVLLLEPPADEPELRDEYLRFVMRWQQFTGPVMAKGLEDTAFYVDAALLSRNEVGGDPLRDSPPLDRAGFHSFCMSRQAATPATMNATSTHDTKRSEDVRARLWVLSEPPMEWDKRLAQWRKLNAKFKKVVDGQRAPSPSEEVMLYQTLLGAWPLDEGEVAGFPARVNAFLVKALREAKTNSGWLNPNETYETAVVEFVASLLQQPDDSPFLRDFHKFQERVAWYGALNSLAQTVIKIMSPGLPDFYQGCELWDLSMVDPDNRRPVDFARRSAMLECLRRRQGERPADLLKDLLANWRDGQIKLFVTARALEFRRSSAEFFVQAGYVPLETRGPKEQNVVAFARARNEKWVAAVTPRWPSQLTAGVPIGKPVWRSTRLLLPADAPRSWRNLFTGSVIDAAERKEGRVLDLGQILQEFPVSVLSGIRA